LAKDVVSFMTGVVDGLVTRQRLSLVWRDDAIAENMRVLETFDLVCPRLDV
jgi:hypothetical protein